ncbi:hypothetical protein [Trinickia sp.]|uniref:hypothetical protein n=1 Tax=Trinickia sp. TaxID=2571163 RepID=UPI003F7F5266
MIRKGHCASKPLSATLRLLALATAVCAAPIAAYASADDVASLYGPQPPADATYLRVLNLSTLTAKVSLPSGARPVDLGPGAATALDVVRPGTSLQVKVDALAPVLQAGSAPVAGPDTVGATITLAIEHTEAGAWRAVPIAAPAASTDALRAQLRLFNFAEGCDGKVALERTGAQSGAPVVFEHVAPRHALARSINPVAATLVAICGDAVSAPLALPRLAAGQSYSLFLSGPASRPVLRGVLDTLDWPRGAR